MRREYKYYKLTSVITNNYYKYFILKVTWNSIEIPFEQMKIYFSLKIFSFCIGLSAESLPIARWRVTLWSSRVLSKSKYNEMP